MARYLRIYIQLIKFAFMWETTYRWSFLLEIGVEVGYFAVSLLGIKVLYANVTSLAGWSYYQLLVLAGLSMVFSEVLLGLVFIFNLRRLPIKIADGELDLVLVRPINSQFAVSLWQPYFALVPSLVSGVIVVVYAFRAGGLSFNWWAIAPFLVVFISGWVMAYAVSMMVTTLAFWWVNASPLADLAQEVMQMSGRPYQIFSGWWRYIFLWLVPLAFMVTFPAQILLGQAQGWWVPAAVGLAGIFLYTSHKFWSLGLKHYSSASS
jgi:ABC-2 type transport system permease protein